MFIHGVGGTGAAVFANAALTPTAPESTSIANRQTDVLLIDPPGETTGGVYKLLLVPSRKDFGESVPHRYTHPIPWPSQQ